MSRTDHLETWTWLSWHLKSAPTLAEWLRLTEEDRRTIWDATRQMISKHDNLTAEINPPTVDAEELGNRANKALEQAIAERNDAADAWQRAVKTNAVTQEQLDKFMSACADQTIQIMELRGQIMELREQRGVPLSTARDVLKNIDAAQSKISKLRGDAHDLSKSLMFICDARDWLANAIRTADCPSPSAEMFTGNPTKGLDVCMQTNAPEERPGTDSDTPRAGQSVNVLVGKETIHIAYGSAPAIPAVLIVKEINQSAQRQNMGQLVHDKSGVRPSTDEDIGKMVKDGFKNQPGVLRRELEAAKMRMENAENNWRKMVESRDRQISELRDRIELLVNPDAERNGDEDR